MMTPTDFFLGFVLKKIFFDGGGPAKSPAIVFPGGNGAPATTAPPQNGHAAALPAFPANVPVDQAAATPSGTPAPAGFKKAIEVWIVQPAIAQQVESTISGMGPEIGALTLTALKSQFPKGWQAAKTATPQEGAIAVSLLPKWKDGGVVFAFPPGPQNSHTIRAFKMTKHAGSPAAAPPAPAQAPPAAPPASAPPARQAPTAAPDGSLPSGGTLPEVLITADAPDVTSKGGTPVQQVTTVRKGEGLANIAKRLGKPATAKSAVELRQANIPQGPDARWSPTDLTKGGIKKVGRAGGLQPGDQLFVPPAWGFVDAGRL